MDQQDFDFRLGRYVAYAVALAMTAAVWAHHAHVANTLEIEALEKLMQANFIRTNVYVGMLVDCLNEEGFAIKGAAVGCEVTPVNIMEN
jgi:hypothetical protein